MALRVRLGPVLAAVLAGTLRLEAQTGLPPKVFEASSGSLIATMISADATSFVVQADNGAIVTFQVDSGSSIPAGLVRGSRVTVRYDALGENRYRVATVGIPRIPFDPGSTTEPPGQPPEASPAIEAALGEAAVESPASPPPEDLGEISERAPSGLSQRPEATASTTRVPEAADRPPTSRPFPDRPAATADRPAQPSVEEPSRQPGRGVIAAGLVLLAVALGLLAILRH